MTDETGLSHQPDADGGATEPLRPRKKQRKQRPSYSCEECRRLKMRCDRKVPCSNCVRRHLAESCFGAAASTLPSRRSSNVHSKQRQHAVQASQPRSSLEHDQNTSCDHTLDPQYVQQGQEPDQSESSQQQLDAPGPETGPNRPSTRHNQDEFEQFGLLPPSFEPRTVHMHPLPSPPSALADGVAGYRHSIPSTDSNLNQRAVQQVDDGEHVGSYGTLMLSKEGRSKYLGPTASSEWLKDSETQDISDTPLATRAHSLDIASTSHPIQSTLANLSTGPIAFPFNSSPARISTRDLLSQLPLREEASILVESYYRYCAWHHDVAPKPSFEKAFDRIYRLAEGDSSASVNPQELALFFIIMAQGTMFNIEMPSYDSSVEDWLHLSERALVKGDFLSNNMVAGLQTLHLMAHLHLQLDKGRRGDSAWPIWGLVMRLVQAMGMHRDGARWNLPQDVVEERRKVFWELNAADTFQAHCFSRPCAINPEHCDTAFPSQPLSLNGGKSYSILRFELSQLSSEILNMAMKVRKSAYSDVTELHSRLCEFERNLPFDLRCRAAFLSMPSRYPHSEAAIEASPEPSRRSMTISFQQMNLALNISETFINLHRPYYAKALYDDIDDPTKSQYMPSFLTVLERCAAIIAMVSDVHTRFPAVSIRQWNFWVRYHVFGSALCLGTLVLRDPGNDMATFVLAQIDAAIGLFTTLTRQHGADFPRYRRNLQWLMKLRARAAAKISKASPAQINTSLRDNDLDQRIGSDDSREDGEDVELLGWRTRLIERAGQGRQTVRTIHQAATPTGSQITNISNPLQHRSEMPWPRISLPLETADPTDDILHDFWDPILLQDLYFADQPNPLINNGLAWWDDSSAAPNAV